MILLPTFTRWRSPIRHGLNYFPSIFYTKYFFAHIRTRTHKHTNETTNTLLCKLFTVTWKSVSTNLFGPYWYRLNSFVLILLSSLKSFGFNTNDVSFGKRSLVCIFICVLPLLRPQFFRQRHIWESNTELFSLFTSQKKPYMYYMLVCVLLLFTFSVKKNSCMVILRRERAFSPSNVHIIYNMEQKVFGSVCIKGNSNI